MPNFRLLGSIIRKKYLKVADPLKKSRLLFFGCFDLESGRIKLSRPCPMRSQIRHLRIGVSMLHRTLSRCVSYDTNRIERCPFCEPYHVHKIAGERKKAHWKKAHREKAHRKKAHTYISAWENSAFGKKRTRKKSAHGKKRTRINPH